MQRSLTIYLLIVLLAATTVAAAEPARDAPRAADPRLEVVCFAQAPDIRHPINLDFDSRGRLLVIESHTHFRPAEYEGPEHDRIRLVEDTDGDGHADRFSTFFEGTKATMDLAVRYDGSVYVATRSEILRLRDSNDDGAADERQQIVRMETKGDYPHNGLSGLAFDFRGNLLFGMGENMGKSYRLIGADGATIAGGGEGGNVFTCTAEGHDLRRIATGFWNPFGVTIDIFGRIWAVDNDPDSMPPCRLLHVVDGGDYGYQFRYGRSGRHPFQAWNGQLPGTLAMVSGTGEAPCEVVSYESDGLPEEYLGNLLVTSWADHRVEMYALTPRGASYTADRKPFIQGGSEFRPVGLAVAPDGSLFFSDWVRSDYNLHNQGAIWQVRQRNSEKAAKNPAAGRRPTKPSEALRSLHRPIREAAARRLMGDSSLLEALHSPDVRQRATAVDALAEDPRSRDALRTVAKDEPEVALQAQAIELVTASDDDTQSWLDAKQPAAVRLAAVGKVRGDAALPQLLTLLNDDDPFLRSAAVRQLARIPRAFESIEMRKLSPRVRMGVLLAERAAGRDDADVVSCWLDDGDEDVRLLAVKWIADRKLADLRPRVVEALETGDLNVRMYQAFATALGRIDGKEVSEAKMAEHFVAMVADERLPSARRIAALRLVPANNERLTIDLLRQLACNSDESLATEAVRGLAEHPKSERFAILEQIVRDNARSDQVRAEALVGLAERPPAPVELLLDLALGDNHVLRDEALRALTGESLPDDARGNLNEMAERDPETAALVERAAGGAAPKRPPHSELSAWLERLEAPADSAAGRRVFFHPRLAGCYRCHRVAGRGREVGPELSVIGRTERRHLLESILQPSNLVPPHYQVWLLELVDGRSLTGMLLRTHLDEYTYVDPQGKLFQVRTTEIAESRPAPQSIMPAGMVDRLTDQELRDLLAYLGQQR